MLLNDRDVAVFFNTEVSELKSFTEKRRYFHRAVVILNVEVSPPISIQYSLFNIQYSLPSLSNRITHPPILFIL